MRPLLSTALLLLVLAAPADAATRGELTEYADRVAAVWAERQDASGLFLDPASGRPSGGYGNVMIGYALLRAGVRSGDDRLIQAGVRGVSSSLDEPPEVRGVFDLVSVATAYNFARRRLRDEPAFRKERRRWERYLRSTGPPNIDNKARGCIVAPDCFHNHEAVGATADLELFATGLESQRPADELRLGALVEVGEREPLFSQGSAAILGRRPQTGLGLLSDTGSWPLAYHALSTAFMGRSIELLGEDAPPAARGALRRAATTLAGFMAPDGTVAYIGRRQEDLWSLAAAVAAAELAARHTDGTPRDHAVASRALDRMKSAYPLTSRGLPIVPRSGDDAFAEDGVDGNPMTFNGLALYLLNVAADAAPARPPRREGRLPAERRGTAFIDPAQNNFAAVRHGGIWFAVHGRAVPPDLRNDFGLMAAKWRAPGGDWIDVVPPRPFEYTRQTAGPVVRRAGERIVPAGTVSLGNGGAVKVDGPVPVRFTPTARGVRISVRAQEGDRVTYTAYLPEGERYPIASRPRATVARGERRYASCCSTSLVPERHTVRARRARIVSFILEAPPQPAGRPPENITVAGGGRTNWLIVAITAGVLGLFLLVRHPPWRATS